ncbi:MAG: ribonuclease III [Kiritimatiellae bacterium]|nr:ribonuclease III [Kiritimatiellia bacterium]
MDTPAPIFGYSFRNAALLDEALTTPSYKMSFPESTDNQRLEFLGDAVLGLIAADYLFRQERGSQEGTLTERRKNLVSTAALCAAARRMEIEPRLKRNKGADGPLGANTLADAVEAIVGAAWIDGGLKAAKTMFENLRLADNAESGGWSANPKGELQQTAQAMKPPRQPVYETLRVGGTCHSPLFVVRARVDGLGAAMGEGRSRKDAQSDAAAKLLASLHTQNDAGA